MITGKFSQATEHVQILYYCVGCSCFFAGLSERLERSLVVKHGDPVPAVLQCDTSDDGDSDLVEMSDLEDDTVLNTHTCSTHWVCANPIIGLYM